MSTDSCSARQVCSPSPPSRHSRRRASAANRVLAFVLLLTVTVCGPARAAGHIARKRVGFNLARPDIAAFIRRSVRQTGLPRARIISILRLGTPRPELTQAISHPPETTMTWWQYRQRLVTAERIAGGVLFWTEHKELLDRVALRSGVPPEYLVAILGIESRYGRSTGSYREIDTLMTLAFDYPPRERFFQGQLQQFLLLVREQRLDPATVSGSYGGALGALQFLPSSYRRYAVGTGARVNLWTDWPAILGSEARFLRRHGWQRSRPVLLGAHLKPHAAALVSQHGLLGGTLADLRAAGVRVDAALPGTTRAVLVRETRQHGVGYRVGLANFTVLMRYNPSIHYALAVCALARAVRSAALPSAGS